MREDSRGSSGSRRGGGRLHRRCPPASPSSPSVRTIHPNGRRFSAKAAAAADAREEEEGETQSNRAVFRATPVIPSILDHIQKIGVGLRRKPDRRRRRMSSPDRAGRTGGGRTGGGLGDTLDELEESDFFADREKRHRLQWREKRATTDRGGGAYKQGGREGRTGKKSTTKDEKETSEHHGGAYWLPPPPFSSFMKHEIGKSDDSLHGRRVIRRPVKLLGTAGSLADDLPRESRGLSEVAIAGRSNVGKSTLLNALLYGNTDENLAPRKHRRGKTPEGAKLPRGAKAVTSSKPGQTKELSFYQLTADFVAARPRPVGGKSSGDEDDDSLKTTGGVVEKMSLLLVDLPGYGFAFAKEERTKEWNDLMHHYLLERRGLKRMLLLLDARHGFKKADFDFLGNLQDGLMARAADEEKARRELPPIQIVLTKCDLVKQADLARRVVVVRRELSDFLVREPSSLPVMLVSARPGLGFNNLRRETPLGGVLELQRELASLVPTPRDHKRRGR